MTTDLGAFVGCELEPPLTARDEVNAAMIRHWCLAVGDTNPVYTDPEAAARSVFAGLVAPPTMLQAWTMREPDDPSERPAVLEALDEAGFISVVATNSEQTYARYLRPGDRVTVTSVVESVSPEKQTALGAGHFVTFLYTYTDEQGEVVGTQRFRVLKFRPPAPAAEEKRPRPTVGRDNEFFWRGVAEGRLLIQRCSGCGVLRHPPRPMCAACNSLDWEPAPASGYGVVYSYIVPRHPKLPAFGDPYIVVLVELEESVRLVSNLVGAGPEDVRVGLPVKVVFEKVDEELTLPMFRPR